MNNYHLEDVANSVTQQAPLPPPEPPMRQQQQQQHVHSQPNANCCKSYEQNLASIIKPTATGLLAASQEFLNPIDYNERESLSRNSSASPLSSREFKDELLRKQMQLSSNNQQLSVEERIKLNQKSGERDFNSMSPINNYTSQLGNQLPDKLLSTAQRERKPFAYSPDVNDPNNRGKLDLTQIKSPIMRRRLMANMEASEKHEADEQEEVDEIDEQEASINWAVNQPAEQVNLAPHQQQAPPQRVVKIQQFQPAQIENFPSTNRSYQVKTTKIDDQKEPTIQYNSPPRFFSQRDMAQSQFNLPSVSQDNQRLCSQARQEQLDNLSAEINKSIETLSQLATNFGRNSPASRNQQDYQTFSDNNSYWTSQQANQDQMVHSVNSRKHQPSIGDILLSPNSNYLSTSSPGVASPRHNHRNLNLPQTSWTCLHTQPSRGANSDRQRQFAYNNGLSQGFSDESNGREYSELDSLRKAAARMESEFENLRNRAQNCNHTTRYYY